MLITVLPSLVGVSSCLRLDHHYFLAWLQWSLLHLQCVKKKLCLLLAQTTSNWPILSHTRITSMVLQGCCLHWFTPALFPQAGTHACVAQEWKEQNSLAKHNSSVIAENRNTVCKDIRDPSLLLKEMDPSSAGIKGFPLLALMTSERNGISLPSGLPDKWKNHINHKANLYKPQMMRNSSHLGIIAKVRRV